MHLKKGIILRALNTLPIHLFLNKKEDAVLLATEECSNPAGPYPIPLPKPAGQI